MSNNNAESTELGVWSEYAVDEQLIAAPTVQCHAANLLALPDGGLVCAWFGGTQEGMHDIDVYMSRCNARTGGWSTPEKLSADPSRSEQNPVLFLAPTGDLWLFWTAQVAGQQDAAEVRARVSSDLGATWGAQRTLFEPDIDGGVFVRHPPIVRPDGAWVLPVFRCGVVDGDPWSGDADRSTVRITVDHGASWREVDVPDSDGLVHMCVVPSSIDGPLVALFRSRWADHVYWSRSDESAEHWTPPQPTNLPNNNSSIQAIAWTSTELAMVYNHASAADATARRESLYDEITSESSLRQATRPATTPDRTDRRAFWGAPRAPLSLATSLDGGRSWTRVTDLATGDGYCLTNDSLHGLNRELSYPSLARSAGGDLHVVFTYHRRAIKHLRISPAGAQHPG